MEALEKLEEKNNEPLGDGRGLFMEDMTQEEYDEYELLETKKWKKFYDKINNYGK